MLYFKNDYSEGAHPAVLAHLAETNLEKLDGYGSDKYAESAKKKMRAAMKCEDADIRFISGGTQTNMIVIDSVLAPYEGVISARTGHINFHEAGAIEFTGHKVLEIEGCDGKINAESVKNYLQTFYADGNHEHQVFPGMVYITHPTEYGTLYSLSELASLSEVCREYSIPLYLDGARLGYALACPDSDVTLPDIARLCDIFYIGGTKVGALMGEALVFTKGNTPKHFLTTVKQHGALLAKGRVMSVQFDALFTDDLYMRISENAIRTAQMLKDMLRSKGYRFFIDSPTNQVFVILENGFMEKLMQQVEISFWEKYDDTHTVVRFATSWATEEEDVEKLEALLRE